MQRVKKFRHVGLALLAIALLTPGCVVVRQGEFAVRRTLGKYEDKVRTSGLHVFNPFIATIVKISGQTENIEVNVNIPSKEGLTIQSEVSILYRVVQKEAPNLLRNVGLDYENTLILPVFRSAVADVTARYFAKDMHSGSRAEIEVAIRDLMMQTLGPRGIVVEAVLLKSIVLPRNLTKAIEEKLEAEQQAQRMEFVLQQERQEAERKRVQAQGIRDANQIISEGLTPEILQFKAIEAWLELSKSPNAKVIFSNGNIPLVIDADQMSTNSAPPAARSSGSALSRQ
ncbi:MAG: prohibitin family protein [Saprospiraceae bacterium]|nr:prohibitin family protein [Saprospiraceae bacterium]MDW8483135.1 prohibitin family protein [Saprospiraceae bacterium]